MLLCGCLELFDTRFGIHKGVKVLDQHLLSIGQGVEGSTGSGHVVGVVKRKGFNGGKVGNLLVNRVRGSEVGDLRLSIGQGLVVGDEGLLGCGQGVIGGARSGDKVGIAQREVSQRGNRGDLRDYGIRSRLVRCLLIRGGLELGDLVHGSRQDVNVLHEGLLGVGQRSVCGVRSGNGLCVAQREVVNSGQRGDLLVDRIRGGKVCDAGLSGGQGLVVGDERLLRLGQRVVGGAGRGDVSRIVKGELIDGGQRGNRIDDLLRGCLVCGSLLLELGNLRLGSGQGLVVGDERLLRLGQLVVGGAGRGDGVGVGEGQLVNLRQCCDCVDDRLRCVLVGGSLKLCDLRLGSGQGLVVGDECLLGLS